MNQAIDIIYGQFKKSHLISTDTRKIEHNSIFFALRGANFNGNLFAKDALAKGASLAVVDDPSIVGDNIVCVNDVLATLQELAATYRRDLSIPVVGLTGTNGKTTTKELVTRVLEKKFRVHSTKGNLNNQIGVPLTVLSIPSDAEIAVVEMGANHHGDIKELVDIAQPNYGLITNVGRAHLEGFGSFEGVKKTKGELYDFLKANNGSLFLNLDNRDLCEMVEQRNLTNPIVYGGGEMNAAILPKNIENPFLRISVGKGKLADSVICTKIVGDYNIDNILAAVAIGSFFGIEASDIKDAIESYEPGNIRSQLIRTDKNLVIADCYNANPTSMAAALSNFNTYEIENKVLILGDMLELGKESESEHSKVLDLALETKAKSILLVGEEFLKVGGNNCACHCFINVEELNGFLKESLIENAFVLVKGSRGIRLETTLPLF